MTVTAAAGADAEWLTAKRFTLGFSILLLATFPQVFAGLEVFSYADAGQFAYPCAFYQHEAFGRGQLPFWNPLSSCGIPYLAQWNTMTLYPLSLFYLLLPMPWSFEVFCLAHLILAAAGMFKLTDRWMGSRVAAAIAGVAFGFNGMMWQGLVWPHLIAAFAWMPWTILATENAWRRGGRWISVAALVLAVQILSGGAEVILFTWVILGALWILELIRNDVLRGKSIMRMALALALGFGLSAVQTLPFLQLVKESDRGGEAGRIAAAMMPMPLSGWANFLVPLFQCERNPQGVFIQPTQLWTASYYAGISVLALAVLAVLRVKDGRVRILAFLTFVALWLALGEPGGAYGLASRIFAAVRLIRFPIKFVLLATFAIPVLAGFGAASLTNTRIEPRRHDAKTALWIVGAMISAIALLIWAAWRRRADGEAFAIVATNALLRAMFLIISAGFIWAWNRTGSQTRKRLFATGAILACWVDVYTHAPNLVPATAPAALRPDRQRERLGLAAASLGDSRFMLSEPALRFLGANGSSDPDTDLLGRRAAQFMNLNLLDHTLKIDGFYASTPRPIIQVMAHMYMGTNRANGLKDFLGVRYESNPTNALEWSTRGSFLPRVTCGQSPIFATSEQTLQRLVSDAFDPHRMAFLPMEASPFIRAQASTTATVTNAVIGSHRLTFNVTSETPVLAVIAQTYYPAWRASVDGEPARLWSANHAFQALEVPAGWHRVELVYMDSYFFAGLVLLAVAAIACTVLCVKDRSSAKNERH